MKKRILICGFVWMFAVALIQAEHTNAFWMSAQLTDNGLDVLVHAKEGFTNRVEMYISSSLTKPDWRVVQEELLPTFENPVAWGYAAEEDVLFWTCGNMDVDSDMDGLSDAREKFVHKTNPNVSDTDGDGLSDALELCGMFYQPILGDFNWKEAKADAERLGGHLATITSAGEQELLYQFVGEQLFYDYHLWLGAEDVDGDGLWSWVTGEPFEYTHWASTNTTSWPENRPLEGSDRAMKIDYNSTRRGEGQYWYDVSRWYRSGYLLEYPASLDPCSNDSDGDGLNDLEEIRGGSSPVLFDTDGDGLSDAEEVAIGTNPTQSDTDFDGLSDAEELVRSTDPKNPDSDDDGLMDGPELYGSIYYPVYEILHWHDAKAHAELLGGHLATVTSDLENENMIRSMDDFAVDHYNFWLGASDEAMEGNWRWVTGEPFNYTHWRADGWAAAPDNDGNEDFLEGLNGENLDWNDSGDSVFRPYLIEIGATLDPLNPDYDGDGILDGEEIAMGMNPASLDSDGDGLSDAYEYGAGLHGGVRDSDFDGLDDAQELLEGSDPLNPDSDGDGLLDGEEYAITLTDIFSTNGAAPDATLMTSLSGVQSYNRELLHESNGYVEEGNDLLVLSLAYEPSVTWSFTNQTAGMYRLALQLEPYESTQYDHYCYPVELSINTHVIGETVAVTHRGELAEGVVYTPWLEPGTYEITCRFSDLVPFKGDIRFHALEIYSINGVDSDQNGIQDWVEARLNSGTDTDGDGLSDQEELFTLGTDHLNMDTDGDGLDDFDEQTAGTDPANADTDNDGVNDGVEVQQLFSNPLLAEFTGVVTNALTLSGAETHREVGQWREEGTSIKSKCRRGKLEYRFSLPNLDLYRLDVEFIELQQTSFMGNVKESAQLDFYVDGMYLGSRELPSVYGAITNVQVFLPILSPGEHSLSVFWDNLDWARSIQVTKFRFQQLGGLDADLDGQKDWIQTALSNMASVDSDLQSVVSPICLEGAARYVPLMEIEETIVHQGAGNRWYANVPLNSNELTDINVSFQNEALIRLVQAEWISFNLLEHSGETLRVRKGDRVKLVALPEGLHNGQFQLELEGEITHSPGCDPLIYTFDLPGTYVMSGEYTEEGQHIEGLLNITVLDWSFPEEQPACLVNQERSWSLPNVPAEVVIETDDTVALSVIEEQPFSFSLLASEENGTHIAVARVDENGPILAATPINPFWVNNGVDQFITVVEAYEDSELWQTPMVEKHLPSDVQVHIDVFAGGVTLDDYTVERWITQDDFDVTHEYKVRLIHPNSRWGSTCFRVKLYQSGLQIGSAY